MHIVFPLLTAPSQMMPSRCSCPLPLHHQVSRRICLGLNTVIPPQGRPLLFAVRPKFP